MAAKLIATSPFVGIAVFVSLIALVAFYYKPFSQQVRGSKLISFVFLIFLTEYQTPQLKFFMILGAKANPRFDFTWVFFQDGFFL